MIQVLSGQPVILGPGTAFMLAPERNRLLIALPAQEYARLLPDLDSIQLQARQQLTALDEPTERVYFPRDSVVSMLVRRWQSQSATPALTQIGTTRY